MGSVFSKPKAPDMSGLQAQQKETKAAQMKLEKEQKNTQMEQESEIAEREAVRKKRLKGRASLLTGAATGVEEKQTTLG